MAAEEATVAVEEAIVAAEAEEAIEDKDKSSHRSIGGNSKDEGSDSVSGGDSGSVPDRVSDGCSDGDSAARRWRIRRGGGAVAGKFQWTVGLPIKIKP